MGTHYDVLGVPRNATFEQIKKAYREQIKFFHPDVFDGPPEVAEIKTRQLNEAYFVLSDPERRRNYDAYLFTQDQQRKAEEQKRKEKEDKERQEKEAWEKAQRETEESWSKENKAAAEEHKKRKEKQKKPRKASVVVLLILFLLSTSWAVYATYLIGVERFAAQSEIEALKGEYEIVKANRDTYNSNYKKTLIEKSALENRIEELTKENEKLTVFKDLAFDMADEWAFWHDNAVIVTEAGNKYHTYGCYHIGDNGFYIFNLATAEVRGYTPCLDCDPPTG